MKIDLKKLKSFEKIKRKAEKFMAEELKEFGGCSATVVIGSIDEQKIYIQYMASCKGRIISAPFSFGFIDFSDFFDKHEQWADIAVRMLRNSFEEN